MTAADNEELLATTWRDGVQYVWLSDHSRIVASLRARVATEAAMRVQCSNDSEMHLARALAAESQLRQVKADAERWRHARECIKNERDRVAMQGLFWNHNSRRELDASVDEWIANLKRRNDGTT